MLLTFFLILNKLKINHFKYLEYLIIYNSESVSQFEISLKIDY